MKIALSENLKITGGLRFELPIYPSLKNNYNEDFAKLDFGGTRYSTDQLPDAKLSVSPRVGFNWDLTGERKYVLRGGTGLFDGTFAVRMVSICCRKLKCWANAIFL